MTKITFYTLLFILFISLYQVGIAGDFFVYPTKGQNAEQQEQDEFQCYSWAKKQTNFDPMNVPTASSPPPAQQKQKHNVLRGAAAGAVIGEIADDKGGEGAAIGALLGGMRKRSQVNAQQQERQNWEDQQVSQYAEQRNNYNRAYVACLEGKGYNVK